MTQQRDQSGITRLGCRPVPVKEEAGVATPATGNTERGRGREGREGVARRSESARETLRIVVLDTYPCTQLVHTDATMHIRRLLGNGFGLLMTGQLSQQPACIPREPPPLTHAHRSHPRPIVKRASIERREFPSFKKTDHRGFCFFPTLSLMLVDRLRMFMHTEYAYAFQKNMQIFIHSLQDQDNRQDRYRRNGLRCCIWGKVLARRRSVYAYFLYIGQVSFLRFNDNT